MIRATIALTAVACLLAACGTTGTQDFQHFLDGVKELAQDPNCGHTDRIQGNLGGLGGNNLAVYLERTCPAKAPTVTPGAVVAAPPPA